nr:protein DETOXIFICATION 29-like [Ipomoea batatas]
MSTFDADASDIQPIKKLKEFMREFNSESKKLWYLAAPAIFNLVSQYSIIVITQMFAGHVGNIQLAAVSVDNNLIGGFALGIVWTRNTLWTSNWSKETRNARGLHAKIMDYSQRYSHTPHSNTHLLHPNSQTSPSESSHFRSRRRVWPADDSATIRLRIFFSDPKVLTITEQGVYDGEYHGPGFGWAWLIQLAIYVEAAVGAAGRGGDTQHHVVVHGGGALRLRCFRGLCLEIWYFKVLILFVGYTKNAEISVDATSICLNISGWTVMVGLGFSVAISVRVSNELGAGHPRTAKFAVVVATITSLFIGIILGLTMILLRSQYPPWFSKSSAIQQLVYDLTPLLGTTIILNSLQPTLSGVAIGAGWQSYVAYANIVCYYLVGMPIGLVLCFAFNKGVKGIWYGMLTGTAVQTIVLIVMILRTNWIKEASIAGERIRKWGGDSDSQPLELH